MSEERRKEEAEEVCVGGGGGYMFEQLALRLFLRSNGSPS